MSVCYVVSYDHGGLVLWGYEHFLAHFRERQGWLDRHLKPLLGGIVSGSGERKPRRTRVAMGRPVRRR